MCMFILFIVSSMHTCTYIYVNKHTSMHVYTKYLKLSKMKMKFMCFKCVGKAVLRGNEVHHSGVFLCSALIIQIQVSILAKNVLYSLSNIPRHSLETLERSLLSIFHCKLQPHPGN